MKKQFIKFFGKFENFSGDVKWSKGENDFRMYLVKSGEVIEIIDGESEEYSSNFKMTDFDDEMNLKIEEEAWHSKKTLPKIEKIKEILKIQILEKQITKDTKNLSVAKSKLTKF